MKASPIKDAFNAGEFSPLMAARVRIDKYANALKTCENMIPMVQGGVTRRPRTTFVAEVKDSSAFTLIVPFEFNVDQAYILEFGDLYIRFYMDEGVIESSPSVPYEVVTTFTTADLPDLKFIQSADVLYITHPDYAPKKLSRTGHTSWTLTDIAFVDGPYLNTNTAAGYKKITPSAASGTGITLTVGVAKTVTGAVNNGSGLIRLTIGAHDFVTGDSVYVASITGTTEANGTWVCTRISSTQIDLQGSTFTNAYVSGGTTVPAIFVTTDVGRHVRIKHSSTWGYAKITAFTNPGSVTADVIEDFGATTASGAWRLGVWSDTTGYPSCAMFFEDRLFFAGCTNYPNRIDGSRTGDYDDFSPSDADGTVTASHGLAVTLNSANVNKIQWLMDDEKGLLVGTAGGEWIVRPSTLSEAMSSTNVTAKRSTAFGSSQYQAIRAGRASLYTQRSGRKVRELAYVYEVDGFRSPDMTVMSEHISTGGLTYSDYQQEPWGIVWFVRSDGQLIGLTYERDQDVIGWHRHIIGGAFGSGDAVVESIAVIPNPEGTADQLWMVVKRTIDGGTKRYVEYMEDRFDATTTVDAMFADSGLTYDGSPTTSITGLAHLEGETVQVLADGATHPDRVVTSGAITLNRSASVVHVGLGYQSNIQTLNIEAGAQDGTAQGKMKRIHSVTVRLFKTLGLKFGPRSDKLDTMTFRTTADPMGSPPELFTGDKRVEWNGSYEVEGAMYFRQEQPLPFTMLGIFPQLKTEDRG